MIVDSRAKAWPRIERADDEGFVEACGERIALFSAGSRFECWMWPVLLFHDLELSLRVAGVAQLLGARTVTVVPEGLGLAWRQDGFTLRMEAFAARDERALVLLFGHDAPDSVTLELTFRPALRPMWPAGIGGQIARRDDATGAFLMTEELGRFAALIGSPESEMVRGGGDRGIAGEVTVPLPISAARARRGPVPLFVAGAQCEPEPLSEAMRLGGAQSATGTARAAAVIDAARAAWRTLATGWPDVLDTHRDRWWDFLNRTAKLTSSDPAWDAAFLWSTIAIERAWVRVDGLGRTLVAGLGPGRGTERPGFAWFFNGDALVASRALSGLGEHASVREILRWAAGTQRDDGKLAHEVTLSAGLCDWFDDYPYAYYKAQQTPGFVTCLEHYVAHSGDDAFARELWPHVASAIDWCAGTCDGEGRMRVPEAGIAAVEAGPLANRIASELFLHGIWISALQAGIALARRLAMPREEHDWSALHERAESARASFWDDEKGRYAFAHLEGGGRNVDLSAYLALAVGRAPEDPRAVATARQLNRPELCADWGARMFATDSEVYDPNDYNTGAVFPYLTHFTVMALYANGLAPAAHQVLRSQLALEGFAGAGYLPEHLAGDRAHLPERSVPHQVFSQTTVLQGTLYGMLGLSVVGGTLHFVPRLPADLDHVLLERFCAGDATIDLELTRTREQDHTVYRMRVTPAAPSTLELRCGLALPPLTVPVDARSGVTARTLATGAVELSFAPRALDAGASFAVAVRSGPELVLPAGPLERDAPSRNPRLSDQRTIENRVHWTLHGPAGDTVRLRLVADGRTSIDGAQREGEDLLVTFPRGAGFTETEVAVEIAP
ncbi:MAG: hypothetical protein GY711_23855 [bacterium]|nr:hypothetical protein [bacterium]